MSAQDHDLSPVPNPQGAATGEMSVVPPAGGQAPAELPPALLAFYSPSAALIELPPSDAARYVIWIVGALVAAALAVMTFLPLDRVVSVNGRLSPFDDTMVLQPLETAIIRSIDVHEGDRVRKGQVLARLDPTMTDADVTNLRRQVMAYRAEVARRMAEATGQPYVADMKDPASVQEAAAYLRRQAEYNAQMASYDRQIAGLESELQGHEASAAMYAARVRVARDVQDMRVRLQHEQVGSRLSTLAAQDTLMEVVRAQVSARHEADSTRARLDAMKAQRDGYASNWHATVYQDLALAQHRLADADGGYSKAMLHHDLIVMRAGRDAVVLSIAHLSTGSVIQAASPLMTLVPLGGHLDVEASLRGVDAGYVRVGDRALLKFAAFPYTQYGGAEASVRVISADSFDTRSAPGAEAAQQGGDGALDPQAAYYRVRLSIDRYTLHGVPPFFQPQPGMPVEADIHVGRRTMMQYLLNRLLPAVTDGMREP
ncbi:HlyD family type I secretion periplasmic adaptor subunit [Komagataeibacter sp. FNDCR2]|uniref:HlyD family type I secretion periplasmic adaptor subunit n=1 Tax=Komagataeibacter sp. FNDCR2 TaxID=2878682 RepID=UPI001E49863A|nr:HlyD family type I secretion periplasmic adaptor subunit [Komagataeibacter sp. FNDCR2]MCE2575925.1 HlyD family type I secretion periplasmic adaptor subunit [Komagataeibacter sp. FNDCR2]